MKHHSLSIFRTVIIRLKMLGRQKRLKKVKKVKKAEKEKRLKQGSFGFMAFELIGLHTFTRYYLEHL